jgi:hypothetical protein
VEARAAGNVFGGAWKLLVRNVAIVLPGLVAAALAAVVQAILLPAESTAANAPLWPGLVQWVVQIVTSILSISYTTGMANAAWATGRATFADGGRAYRRDGGHVFVAMLALFVLGAGAAVLAAYTFSLSLVAYAFFFIYTMASAVVGERSGFAAVAESVRIAIARPVPTLLVVAGIALVAFVSGLVAILLAAAPLVGPLVEGVLVQVTIAYAVLVVVGEYRALRNAGASA